MQLIRSPDKYGIQFGIAAHFFVIGVNFNIPGQFGCELGHAILI